MGGGWYGRVFLAELEKEPKSVIVKIHLFPNLAQKEACQLDALAAHGIAKMPQVYFTHTANGDIPYDAIMMEYIEGINAGNYDVLNIKEEYRAAIAEQIVDNLLSYHKTINLAGFGEIGASNFELDWRKYYKVKADEAMSKGEKLYENGKIDESVIRVMRKAHAAYDRIFYLPIDKARLIHGDYNTWNILLDENATYVSGVIDPLNCCYADAEKDLYQLNQANGKQYGLLKRYAEKMPLSENFFMKSSFYELFDHIAHYYDTNVDIDQSFLLPLASNLEQQMSW